MSISLRALVNPDNEYVSTILFPGDEVPVTTSFLPFLMDWTKRLSIFELSDHALSSTGNNFVIFPSTLNITSLLRLKLKPALIETSCFAPPFVFVTKTKGLPRFSLSNLPVVLMGVEVIKQVLLLLILVE